MSFLKDTYGRVQDYLRISVTDRCNFRCFYCLPSCGFNGSPRDQLLTFEEIIRISGILAGLGVRKIRLTGGEPLLRKNLPFLIRELKGISGVDTVGLTTNGFLLEKHVHDLRKAGLDRLNISLDTLSEKRFRLITGHAGFRQVMRGIESSFSAGFHSVKINTVVIKGTNDDEICDFIHHFSDYKTEIRFIEFMPYGRNEWKRDRYISSAEIRKAIENHYDLSPLIKKEKSRVADSFSIDSMSLKIGFISSNSSPFCSNCSRLRISSDGILRTCLYSINGYDLKSRLRNSPDNEVIKNFVLACVKEKPQGHGPVEQMEQESEDLIMTKIGG